MFLSKVFGRFLAGMGALSLLACASPQPLTGGAKDTSPPKIIESESTPNTQTSFTEKEIVLTFDEWVVLKDIEAQLVISPLMPKKPEIKQKGKSIHISLPDSLRENTTYSMNFGNAIQDLNEGNKLDNFSFIFSTGTFLDSIRLQGRVMDAVTLKPAVDVWVMLYSPGDDSLVYRQKPEYLAKANKEGRWSISNIRTDSFIVVALKDENLNFLYDQEAELFGWLDEPIFTDVSATLPELQVSAREKKSVIADVKSVAPGWMKMNIAGPAPKNIPSFIPPLADPVFEWEGDSLFIWYSPDVNYSGKAVLGTDTTRLRSTDFPSIKNRPVKLISLSGKVHPAEAVKLKGDVPLQMADSTRMEVRKDTTGAIPFEVHLDSISTRLIQIHSNWVQGGKYSMRLLPGAVTDIWGRTNDTVNISFIVSTLDQYSNLDMKVSNLDSAMSYVVLIKAGENITRSYSIENQTRTTLTSRGLQPGKYTIELIEDRNANGRWDTGNYELKRQPERKKIFVPENLRAGWDVEVKMDWDTTPDTPIDKEKK